MLSRMSLRAPAALLRQQVRCFAHPVRINMIDSDYNAPASEKPLYLNQFVVKPAAEHAKDIETAVRPPVVHDTTELIPADTGDPHNTYGMAKWAYIHYDSVREPTFPRKPDVTKGELVSGAQFYRTDAWYDPKEPAITSVAKYSPENIRPVGWAEHAPQPTTTCPDNSFDFRHNRLPIGHADRRPFIYFMHAAVGFVSLCMLRTSICKALHTLWPAKDVFAAGVLQVDLRPILEGQNTVVKWRNKPVFIRWRTQAQIEMATKDDVLAPSMRDPALDSQRCSNPKWLIAIGSCTHLGCIPQPDAGNYGGYFCPCHGSHYDYAGRIRQGPAPKNLELPPYSFLDENTVKLG